MRGGWQAGDRIGDTVFDSDVTIVHIHYTVHGRLPVS